MWSPELSNASLTISQSATQARRSRPLIALFFIANCTSIAWAASAKAPQDLAAATPLQWPSCQALTNDAQARLRCYDRWAAQQGGSVQATTVPAPQSKAASAPQSAPLQAPVIITLQAAPAHDCKSAQFSELSRFWELEAGSDCGSFGIRGYHPISLSWIGSDSVNTQPSSPSPPNNASTPVAYRNSETRVGLSVRTKIAQGLLTRDEPLKRDSIWFAYSQQSNWQLFSGDLSRPFRTTDHEPELIYIYPFDAALPWGWRLRYGGLSLNHQSNGQPLPFSRSWNRTILIAGMEHGTKLAVQAKFWQRLPEVTSDDDNPDIDARIGRAEVAGFWRADPVNTLGLTLRHALINGNSGSFKLEWLRKLGDNGAPTSHSGLRFHTQLSSGYGDSLIDYNRRRTVLSVGLSLVDW